MTLKELSAQYRESGELIRGRLEALNRLLTEQEMGETERLLLRRRIHILSAMARETVATANYLYNYYGDGADEGKAEFVFEGRGVSGAAALH